MIIVPLFSILLPLLVPDFHLAQHNSRGSIHHLEIPFPNERLVPLPMKKQRMGYPGRVLVDSVIRSDFLCNDDTSGGCKQIVPDIALGKDGTVSICWCDFRDGDADVWFQRFDSSGRPLGSNERINTDITLGWQGDPAVAASRDGWFIFSWEDRRQIGNSDVFSQRFDSEGERVGDNFRVSDSTAAGDQCISALHIAPDGTTLIVWDDRRYGLGGDIFAQWLNPDGSLRGENFRVNDDPIGLANQYEPDVEGDSAGNFVVAWMDGRGRNSRDWNIFGQRFRSDGTRLGNNFQITTDDSIQWTPRVAVAPGGKFLVCWDDFRRGQWDVYAQFFNSTGQPVDTNFRVNSDQTNAEQHVGDAAANSYSDFIIVWTDIRNGNDDIYAQRFDSAGNRLGGEIKINDDTGTAKQYSPAVTAASDGGYWVAWVDEREGNPNVYCQRLARDGGKIGENFRVNDDFASSHQRVSSVGMERQGTILIAWEDERGTSCDIYCTLLDSLGREIIPNLMVNDDTWGTAGQYYPSAAGGNNKFLVVWTDGRDGWNIYGQFFDSRGSKLGNNFRVNSDAGNAHQWYPYCAMDSYNRAVVVWMDSRDGVTRIYARLYDQNGMPVGEEFPVADTLVAGYYASVAMNSTGNWVVSWMDYRRGESDIFCQLFRPDGTRIGSNIRVNTDEERVYQGYPSCAISDIGDIAIAWEDTRNNYYDVYLQWFDSLGTRLGENERVNDNAGGVDCYSPSCAFEQSGRLVVLFNDERENPGNPQIYCQRFAGDRTRIGRNAQINEPNLFPKNTHWTVGQSVAANSSSIVFTWTDNRRHAGWDIYAKITDWELIVINENENTAGNNKEIVSVPTVVLKQQQIKIPPKTTVRFYDVSGRMIKGSSSNNSGNLLVGFNSFSSGAYFCILRRGEKTEVKKIIVK